MFIGGCCLSVDVVSITVRQLQVVRCSYTTGSCGRAEAALPRGGAGLGLRQETQAVAGSHAARGRHFDAEAPAARALHYLCLPAQLEAVCRRLSQNPLTMLSHFLTQRCRRDTRVELSLS